MYTSVRYFIQFNRRIPNDLSSSFPPESISSRLSSNVVATHTRYTTIWDTRTTAPFPEKMRTLKA